MEKSAFDTLFRTIFATNGLERYVNDETITSFYTLTEHMMAVNAVMNLTALDTPEKIIPLHYADCALAAACFPKAATVADVGCGGGFPTLPLAILRPDLHITAIDSTCKKVAYVAETAHLLGLDNIETITARAEELGHDPTRREHFDVVTSRAVARLNVLDELCLPLCRVGGQLILLKGAAGPEELAEARNGILQLGGSDPACEEMELHTLDGSERRTLIRVRKVSPTPNTYPRGFGQIKKRPL